MARPSSFTQEVADLICERISDGESLRTICDAEDMPSRGAVFRWLAASVEFQHQYARARDEQADFYAEDIIAISDEEVTMIRKGKHQPGSGDDDAEVEVVFDSAAVARNRLRVDARKWVASKLAPKKYGDKVQTELTGAEGGPIKIEDVARPKLTKEEWLAAHGLK